MVSFFLVGNAGCDEECWPGHEAYPRRPHDRQGRPDDVCSFLFLIPTPHFASPRQSLQRQLLLVLSSLYTLQHQLLRTVKPLSTPPSIRPRLIFIPAQLLLPSLSLTLARCAAQTPWLKFPFLLLTHPPHTASAKQRKANGCMPVNSLVVIKYLLAQSIGDGMS